MFVSVAVFKFYCSTAHVCPPSMSVLSYLVQCLTDVIYYVVGVLNADRQSHQVRSYSCFSQLLFRQLAVCVACRMQHA